ncbi:hypothetical protein V1477_001261 [Vespula maculifrons]|uniref:Uncharacterized protein n=1 Tax=Vespula maculifrons TaxID=7453 RepID=A0ABD2CZE3_VESMC
MVDLRVSVNIASYTYTKKQAAFHWDDESFRWHKPRKGVPVALQRRRIPSPLDAGGSPERHQRRSFKSFHPLQADESHAIEKKSRGLATEKSRVSYLKHPTREIPIASEDLDVGVEEKEAWRAKAKVCLWPLSFNIGAGMQGLGGKEASGDRFDGWAVRSRIYGVEETDLCCLLVTSGNGEKADAIVHNSTLLIDNPRRITRFNPSQVEKKSFLLAYNYRLLPLRNLSSRFAQLSRLSHPRGRERICQSGFLIYFGVTTPEARWRPRQNERSMRRDPPIDQPKSFDLVDLTSSTLLHGLSSCEAFSSLA